MRHAILIVMRTVGSLVFVLGGLWGCARQPAVPRSPAPTSVERSQPPRPVNDASSETPIAAPVATVEWCGQTLSLHETDVACEGSAAGRREQLDLSALASLDRLRRVEVSYRTTPELSPLAGISTLEVLVLRSTRVGDLGPLESLSSLKELRVEVVEGTDTRPLGALVALETLNLAGSKVDDFAFLRNLDLRALDVQYTPFSDLAVLESTDRLVDLDLTATAVRNFDRLGTFTSLERLHLSGTSIRSLKALEPLTNLRQLSIGDTPVVDFAPLAGFPQLEVLDISATSIRSLRPLQRLERLQKLLAYDTKIRTIDPITGLPGLKTLMVPNRVPVESLKRYRDAHPTWVEIRVVFPNRADSFNL